MASVLHGSARTTPRIRAELQAARDQRPSIQGVSTHMDRTEARAAQPRTAWRESLSRRCIGSDRRGLALGAHIDVRGAAEPARFIPGAVPCRAASDLAHLDCPDPPAEMTGSTDSASARSRERNPAPSRTRIGSDRIGTSHRVTDGE